MSFGLASVPLSGYLSTSKTNNLGERPHISGQGIFNMKNYI
jgi:hypothetical protein